MFGNRSVGINTNCSEGHTLNKSNSPAHSACKPKDVTIGDLGEVKTKSCNQQFLLQNMVMGQDALKCRADDSESETNTARVLQTSIKPFSMNSFRNSKNLSRAHAFNFSTPHDQDLLDQGYSSQVLRQPVLNQGKPPLADKIRGTDRHRNRSTLAGD